MTTSSKVVSGRNHPAEFSQLRKKGHLLSAVEVPRECIIRKGWGCPTSRTVFDIYSGSLPSVGRVL